MDRRKIVSGKELGNVHVGREQPVRDVQVAEWHEFEPIARREAAQDRDHDAAGEIGPDGDRDRRGGISRDGRKHEREGHIEKYRDEQRRQVGELENVIIHLDRHAAHGENVILAVSETENGAVCQRSDRVKQEARSDPDGQDRQVFGQEDLPPLGRGNDEGFMEPVDISDEILPPARFIISRTTMNRPMLSIELKAMDFDELSAVVSSTKPVPCSTL